MLKLEDVHKSFGSLEVLRGVDLEVERGTVVCVIGPSGSGKSTLLRCINLLEPPDAGPDLARGQGDHRRRRQGERGPGLRPPPGRDGVPAVQPVPAQDRARERLASRRRRSWAAREQEARAKAEALLGAGRPRRQAQRVPGPALRRPAAAGRDRAGAGDGPARDAVRRGDERARPRAGQGGPRRDARAGRRGHDDGRRHPRDGLRARRRRRGRVHGRRRDRRAGGARRGARATRARSARSASSGSCSGGPG